MCVRLSPVIMSEYVEVYFPTGDVGVAPQAAVGVASAAGQLLEGRGALPLTPIISPTSPQ